MTITNDARVGVYYDPYDLDIAAEPVADLCAAARGSAALPQRALRLLGDLAPRRRREGAGELGDVLQLPQRHPRARQLRVRHAQGRDDVRGPAGAHHAARADGHGCSRRAGWPRSRTRSGGSASIALTRMSVRTASTSSPNSRAMMPMRVIGMLLGIPESDQIAVRDANDANLRTKPGAPMKVAKADKIADGSIYADYVEWRVEEPVRRPDDRAAQHGVRQTRTASPASCTARRSCTTRRSSPARATRPPAGSSAGWPRCSPSIPTSGARSTRTARC